MALAMTRQPSIPNSSPRISRRHCLRAASGLAALRLGFPELSARAEPGATSSPHDGRTAIRSCIFIFQYGGPSHLETWDLKPNAPAEVRGDVQPIASSVPGVQVGEHLPRLAQRVHKLAIIRSMSHGMRAHDSACTETYTGRHPPRGDVENFAPLDELTASPGHGALLSYVRRSRAFDLPHAALPFYIHNLSPPPGQRGGFLGTSYDPFLISGDPAALTYNAEVLRLPEEVSRERLDRRAELLSALDGGSTLAASARVYYEKAFGLLHSEKLRQALDLEQEPKEVRERYGMAWRGAPYVDDASGGTLDASQQLRGQNLLLARRLVEAGVPFINVSDFRQQGANWDTHTRNMARLKGHLLPRADQSISALIDDLETRGLLESTLVVCVGEFGRTPRINKDAGRDHWPDCYSAVLAGGGVQGGAVYGTSDKLGAYPASDPVTPADLAATIFWRFGLDPASTFMDPLGRPLRLAEGQPVRSLFG